MRYDVEFKALDGTTLSGWFYPAGENAPAVVISHGVTLPPSLPVLTILFLLLTSKLVRLPKILVPPRNFHRSPVLRHRLPPLRPTLLRYIVRHAPPRRRSRTTIFRRPRCRQSPTLPPKREPRQNRHSRVQLLSSPRRKSRFSGPAHQSRRINQRLHQRFLAGRINVPGQTLSRRTYLGG